jgi:hypothetical protein
MTIDPDTGVVNWTARGPMFDRTMNVGWGVTVDEPTAQPVTGTLQVTDPSRTYALLRFGTPGPSGRAGLSVGDFDNDGDAETLIMGQRRLYELETDGAAGYRQSWVYPYALDLDAQFVYRSAVATGDADGDGLHEVFAVVGRTITKLDGAERRRAGTVQLDPGESCDDLEYADLENDGAADLFCLARSEASLGTARILVIRASDLSTRYEFAPAAYGRALAVGNVDTDPARELVTANGYVFDGATLVNDWSYGPGFGEEVDTGDLDGDGIEEIVATTGFSARGYSATLRSQLWEVTDDFFDFSAPVVADVAGDSRAELIVADPHLTRLTVYRYNKTTNVMDVVDQAYSETGGTTAIGVGDIDDDGRREIVRGSYDGLNVFGFDPTLTIEWTTSNPRELAGPFKGGMLAGSALESPAPLFLSLRTNSAGSRLVRMPSDGGALEISAEIDTNPANSGALDIVDYDDDGTDEAFVASNAGYNGVFRAYDFFAGASEWSSSDGLSSAAVDVTHADLTGDGRDELIGLTGTGVVLVHDVYQSTLVWQSAKLFGGQRVLVANVDGAAGGESEIVIVTPQSAFVYRQAPQPARFIQAGTYTVSQAILDAAIGDTDGDGDVEIMLLTGLIGNEINSAVVTLDSNLQPVSSLTLPWPAQTIDIEPSQTGRKNLIIGRRSDRDDGQITIVGARSGNIVWESPPLVGVVQPGSVHYVTLPGETVPRISIGTSAGMYLTR